MAKKPTTSVSAAAVLVKEEVIPLLRDGKSLHYACEKLQITRQMFLEMVAADTELSEAYRQALADRADAWVDRIIDVANDTSDVMAFRWLLSKLHTDRFGDKSAGRTEDDDAPAFDPSTFLAEWKK